TLAAVGLRRAAARHQVQHLVRGSFDLVGADVQTEAPVIVGFPLGQLGRLTLTRRVEGHGRAGDGAAGTLDLARELWSLAALGGGRVPVLRRHPAKDEAHGASEPHEHGPDRTLSHRRPPFSCRGLAVLDGLGYLERLQIVPGVSYSRAYQAGHLP